MLAPKLIPQTFDILLKHLGGDKRKVNALLIDLFKIKGNKSYQATIEALLAEGVLNRSSNNRKLT